MVTTFNARLLNLNNRFKPIVGGNKRKHYTIDHSMSITKHQQTSTTMKRQASTISSSYYIAHTHAQDSAAASAKRRRQDHKENLQFTAATIQSALANAGRPPMSISTRERRERALPMSAGCNVDRESCKVMTSKEFDEFENDFGETSAADQEDVLTLDALNQSSSQDVSSMYMQAGLIQSTRHYYSFASNDETSTSNPPAPNSKQEDQCRNSSINSTLDQYTSYIMNNSKINNNNNNINEDNSEEGFSSWGASSSCNYLNIDNNNSKNIDNDNRSDGVSINVDASATGGSSSSSSLGDSINAWDDGCFDGPFSIIG